MEIQPKVENWLDRFPRHSAIDIDYCLDFIKLKG